MPYKLFKERILESAKSAKKNFLDKGFVNAIDFERLKEIDFTPSNAYLEKFCSWVYKDKTKINDINDTVSLYKELLDKKFVTDVLLTYKSFNDFKNFISNIQVSEPVLSNRQKRRQERYNDNNAELILENDEWILLKIKSYKGSKLWGTGAKWCISSRDNDNDWNNYTDNGFVFYFLCSKTEKNDTPNYKFAIGVHDRTEYLYHCYNAVDDPVSLKYVLKFSNITDLEKIISVKQTEFMDIVNSFKIESLTYSKEYKNAIDFFGGIDFSEYDVLNKRKFNFDIFYKYSKDFPLNIVFKNSFEINRYNSNIKQRILDLRHFIIDDSVYIEEVDVKEIYLPDANYINISKCNSLERIYVSNFNEMVLENNFYLKNVFGSENNNNITVKNCINLEL